MLRPRKKYTIYDLQKLKGKRCLTHIHVKSPEEAAAAMQTRKGPMPGAGFRQGKISKKARRGR